MAYSVATFHNEVIDLGLDIPANLWLENFPGHSGESWACVFQTLWHLHETKGSKRGNEASFFLVLFRHPTLMVAGKAIEEGHNGRVGH
jgi:hypothetical protein